MLDKPQFLRTTALPTAVIRFTIPRAEIRNVMGPGIAEVMAAVAKQGVAPIGPVFSHHLKIDPETFDFEVGVPVATAVQPVGRVRPSVLPSTKVARTVYHGGYEGLGAAWGEFSDWIEAQGFATRADLWESYLAGPESSPDPVTWRTELNKTLVD